MVRTIYLPDELLAILSEHVRLHTPTGEPSRWLFSEDGRPWHDNLVDYRWRSTRTDAGLGLKLHELRRLLRQRPDRCRVRHRHRATSDGSRVRDNHAEHVRPPLAERRGQDPSGGIGYGGSRPRGYASSVGPSMTSSTSSTSPSSSTETN